MNSIPRMNIIDPDEITGDEQETETTESEDEEE